MFKKIFFLQLKSKDVYPIRLVNLEVNNIFAQN